MASMNTAILWSLYDQVNNIPAILWDLYDQVNLWRLYDQGRVTTTQK